jgi:hypothetical protein
MGITLGSIGIIFDVYGDDRCCINCMEGYNHVSLFESSCEHTFLDRGQGTNARLPFPQIVSLDATISRVGGQAVSLTDHAKD